MSENLPAGEKQRIEAKYRIPVRPFHVTETRFILCLAEDSELPTDKELEMLSSYCEYETKGMYGEKGWQAMATKAYPGTAGHNTASFRKNKNGGWQYQRFTWTLGPFPRLGEEPWTLMQVLDNMSNLFPQRWEEWKKVHGLTST